MALTLKLESHASLPGGGPVAYAFSGNGGVEIGRDRHMNWSLPDPERLVSGRHCQILRQGEDYLLIDFSTNGTFVNGAQTRMQSPYRLKTGDRLQIGEYLVSVAIHGDAPGFELPQSSGALGSARPVVDHAAGGESLWDIAGDVAAPTDPKELRPKGRAAPVYGDFLTYHVDAPRVTDRAQFTPAFPATPATPEPFFAGEPGRAPEPRRRAAPAAGVWGAAPEPAEVFSPAEPAPAEVFAPPPAPAAPPPAVLAPVAAAAPVVSSAPAPAPVAAPVTGGAAAGAWEEPFIGAFLQAAGLEERPFALKEAERAGAALGRFVAIAVAEMQALLRARVETKLAARSSEHTMIRAQENNPLKFLPTPEEAIRVMFGPPSRAYLGADKALAEGFGDLKRHQAQTFIAMQQALQVMFAELDPARIEDKLDKPQGAAGLFKSHKTQLWDAYLAGWQAMSMGRSEGMIENFMLLFGNFYDRAGEK